MSRNVRARAGASKEQGFNAALDEIARTFDVRIATSASSPQVVGSATVSTHFGEIIQGAWPHAADADRPAGIHARRFPAVSAYLRSVQHERPLPLRSARCLVDLPCPVLSSHAVVEIGGPASGSGPGPGMTKARAALDAVLALSGFPDAPARLTLSSNIPQGKGCGSSSADVLATIRAACSALDFRLPSEAQGLLLCLVEKASNPAHLSAPAVFAHRSGIVLRHLAETWPAFEVLGIDPGGTVLTDHFAPRRYSEDELRAHSVMFEALTHAFRNRDQALIARIASSAAQADPRLPHDHRELQRWVREYRALGYCVSHSGTVSALLWSAGPAGRALRGRAEVELKTMGRTWAWSL